jgi:hypothetical protein
MLGEPAAHVHGHLEALWESAYARGDPAIGDASDVEAAAEWDGMAGAFCKAALQSGFLDDVDGVFHVHDLLVNAPAYVAARARKVAELKKPKFCRRCGGTFHAADSEAQWCSAKCRQAAYRGRVTAGDGDGCNGERVTARYGDGCNGAAGETQKGANEAGALQRAAAGAATETEAVNGVAQRVTARYGVLHSDQPSPALKTKKKNPPTPPWGANGFDQFWSEYPRKVDKADARRAWNRLRPSAALCGEIMAGLRRWKQSEQWLKDGGQFVPYAQKFLNKRRWEVAPTQTPVEAGESLADIDAKVRARREQEARQRAEAQAGRGGAR